MSESFIGNTQFVWFVGVVEDRFDPEHAGRLRVRCLGHHNPDKNAIATSDLPWSSVIYSDGGISGLGSSPGLFVEGTWVWGYFRDGHEKQEPVILGSLPGVPSEFGDPNTGFYDPNRRIKKVEDNNEEDDHNKSVYPKEVGEPDVNRLAVNNVNKEHSSLTTRKANRTTNVATAEFTLDTTAADDSNMGISLETTWSQPEIPYKASYPYNHVYETESGHIREYDDSFSIDADGVRTNHYRIHERHTSGTSYEIDSSGNKVDSVVGDHYNITDGKSQSLISGSKDLSIDGHYKLYINKSGTLFNNYDIQIGAGANINIQVDSGNVNITTGNDGKMNLNSGGDFNLKVGGNYNMTVAGSRSVSVSGSTTDNTVGSVVHTGSTIDLN